jgi:ketosteroid isomerase-like protein
MFGFGSANSDAARLTSEGRPPLWVTPSQTMGILNLSFQIEEIIPANGEYLMISVFTGTSESGVVIPPQNVFTCSESKTACSAEHGCSSIERRPSKPPGFRSKAMSQENVEIARKAFEDWNRGDLDGAVEWYDDDAVFRTAEGWPEHAIHGKTAVRSFLEDYVETVGHDTVVEDLIDAGNSVVVRLRARLSGDHSGIEGDSAVHGGRDLQKGQGGADRVLLGSPGGPRSRRAAGVGDVAGERGVDLPRFRHVQPKGSGGVSGADG